MKKIILIFSSLFFLSTGVFAQHSSWCGTEISQEWMDAFYQRDKTHLATHKIGNYPEVYIPIVYHLIGEDNGTGYYGLHELFRSHCDLQDLFNDADVFFYIKEINYIDNSSYYDGNNTYGLFQNFNDRDACNVYVVDDMDGVCGYSFVPEAWDGSGWSGPNRGGIMLQKGCMQVGNTTYRHEMGHYLNLPHTFFGWEGEDAPGIGMNAPNFINGSPVERADGSNCYASGDGFCDTPPDYLSDRWNCNFTRNYNDPNGTTVTMDEKNFMSYSNDGCSSYLKDEQLAEVNAAPAAHRPYLLNDPVPVIPVITGMTGFEPSGITNNLNPNNVVISWDATTNAEYYHLQATLFNFNNPSIDIVIEDTFYIIQNASSNAEYEWRVRPINLLNVCTDFSDIREFSISGLSADIDITNSSCSQNSDGSIEVNVDQNGNYNYFWTCDDPFINSQIQNVNSNVLSNLTPETYAVTVVSAFGDTLYSEVNVIAPNEIDIQITQTTNGLLADITGGSPPYSFVWDTGDEVLNISELANGDYTIIVVDQNGCQKTATATYDETFTSIRDVNNDVLGNILLAPNPSKSGFSNLIVPIEKSGDLVYTITDISGKVLIQESAKADKGINSFPLNVNDLSNGIYIVNIQFDNISKSAKLVIQNN